MHGIIGRLEALGSGYAGQEGASDVLLTTDPQALAVLIGARQQMACLIMAPDDEPAPAEQPEQPDDQPQEPELRVA